MTPQEIATERLAGWHAAERGEMFDFRRPLHWLDGHMLWTQAHIAVPVNASRPPSIPTSSKTPPARTANG